jgi:pimeloyl-ACP methyl ester carboxylesterase
VQVRRFRDVGHWIQNEAPGEVNRAMVEFLR